jgi:hypothetical protein
MGPQYNVAQAIVEKMQLFSEADNATLHHYIATENKNFGGIVTGETKTVNLQLPQFNSIKIH